MATDIATLKSDYDTQTGIFASKMQELQDAKTALLNQVDMIDPSDAATLAQWNSALDSVYSAINKGTAIQNGINTVEGWYQGAVNWTADQMWNVGHALGLNGVPQQQNLGGLGFVQAGAVAGVVATIAAWLAIAAVALAAAYAAISAVQAHYNPSAIQNYNNAHDAVYNADVQSGMDPATALADANAQFPAVQAPIDTSGGILGSLGTGVQQIAVYGILAWLAVQLLKG